MMIALVAASKDFQRVPTMKKVEVSSKAKSTPPKGAPAEQQVPTAIAQVYI